VGPRNHISNWVHTGATLRIRLTDPCTAAVQLTLSTCLCSISSHVCHLFIERDDDDDDDDDDDVGGGDDVR